MGQRYGTDVETSAFGRMVNLNEEVFGRVYFPVRSNGLKDIGAVLGADLDRGGGVRAPEPRLAAFAGRRCTTTAVKEKLFGGTTGTTAKNTRHDYAMNSLASAGRRHR